MAIRSDRADSAPEHSPNPTRLSNRKTDRCGTPARRRRLRAAIFAGAAAIALVSSTGCSLLGNAYKQVKQHDCLDEFMIAHRNKVFALKAWYREQECHRNERHLAEFKAGFLKGYMDVADGGNGCLPCTAPNQFWGWRYQSPDGQAAIDAWFAGYPLGVKAAEIDGVGHWGYTHHHNQAAPVAKNTLEGERPYTATPPAETPFEPIEPTPVYGPDGRLLPPGQAIEEIIVPGSEVVVPEAELDALRLEDSLETLDTPVIPGIDDGVMLESSSQPIEASISSSSDSAMLDINPAANFDDTKDLVPKTAAGNVVADELGDEAIEDIFGPADVDALFGPAAETAEVSESIPFKFE